MKIQNLIICFLCFTAVSGRAQDNLKRVVEKDKQNNLTEIYYVLKAENSIKQGEYKLIGQDKKVYVSGNYRNNQRTGVWTFCGNSGELSRKFDFEKDSLVEYVWNKNDSTTLRVKTVGGWKRKAVSSPPFPLYGDLSFILGHSLNYPDKAKQQGVQGTVVVVVRIDKTGAVVASGVRTRVNNLLDIEAMRVVGLISVWYPAVCDGKKTECEYLIPVRFELK